MDSDRLNHVEFAQL